MSSSTFDKAVIEHQECLAALSSIHRTFPAVEKQDAELYWTTKDYISVEKAFVKELMEMSKVTQRNGDHGIQLHATRTDVERDLSEPQPGESFARTLCVPLENATSWRKWKYRDADVCCDASIELHNSWQEYLSMTILPRHPAKVEILAADVYVIVSDGPHTGKRHLLSDQPSHNMTRQCWWKKLIDPAKHYIDQSQKQSICLEINVHGWRLARRWKRPEVENFALSAGGKVLFASRQVLSLYSSYIRSLPDNVNRVVVGVTASELKIFLAAIFSHRDPANLDEAETLLRLAARFGAASIVDKCTRTIAWWTGDVERRIVLLAEYGVGIAREELLADAMDWEWTVFSLIEHAKQRQPLLHRNAIDWIMQMIGKKSIAARWEDCEELCDENFLHTLNHPRFSQDGAAKRKRAWNAVRDLADSRTRMIATLEQLALSEAPKCKRQRVVEDGYFQETTSQGTFSFLFKYRNGNRVQKSHIAYIGGLPFQLVKRGMTVVVEHLQTSVFMTTKCTIAAVGRTKRIQLDDGSIPTLDVEEFFFFDENETSDLTSCFGDSSGLDLQSFLNDSGISFPNTSGRGIGQIQLEASVEVTRFFTPIFDRPTISPFCLVVEDKKLYVPKDLLASKSRFFYVLLFGAFAEANQSEVKISADYEKMCLFLSVLIDPAYEVLESNAVAVAELANLFDVPEVMRVVEKFFLHTNKITAANRITYCDRFNLRGALQQAIYEFRTTKSTTRRAFLKSGGYQRLQSTTQEMLEKRPLVK